MKYQIKIFTTDNTNSEWSFSTIAMLMKRNDNEIVSDEHEIIETAIVDAKKIANNIAGQTPEDLKQDVDIVVEINSVDEENEIIETVECFIATEIRFENGEMNVTKIQN